MGSMRPLATAISCTLVFTQTASGTGVLDKFSLSVYGVGHLSADLNDNGDTSDVTIASNSSRLGFRGGVELSHELSIIAQYENGVDLTARGSNDGNGGTNSDARLFTMFRDSFAGLHHKSFGELVAGRVGALNQYLYDYNFRNDTTFYFAYSGVSNDNNAAVSANNYGHGQAVSIAPEKDPWSVSLGLVYKFEVGLWPWK